MIHCNDEFVRKISQYLDVKPKNLHMQDKSVVMMHESIPNQNIEGFATIIYYLTKISKYSNLLGSDKENKALVQQWLEYIVTCINFIDSQSCKTRVLKELNTILRDNSYMNGTQKSIIDIVLYYLLHPVMVNLNNKDKATIVHVSRWFDNIQQEDKLRQQLDLINFNLLHLYL